MSAATALPFACFGKLPIHGDFIREIDAAPELRIFDDWLQEGIQRSMASLGQSWRREFTRARPQAFLYRCSQTGGVLVGMWLSSRDRHGRLYPFLVATRLPDAAPGPWLDAVPIAASNFLALARAMAETGWQDHDLATFREEVRRQRWEWDAAAAETALDYALARTSVRELFGAAVGSDADVTTMVRLAGELRSLDAGTLPPQLVVRISFLGGAVDVSCWLRLLRVLAPHRETPVLVTWTADRRDNALCMVHDVLSSRYFEPLLWADVEHPTGFDVRGRDSRQIIEAAGGFVRPLIEGDAKLADLTRAIASLPRP